MIQFIFSMLLLSAGEPNPDNFLKVELSDPFNQYSSAECYLNYKKQTTYEVKIKFKKDFRNDGGTGWAGLLFSNQTNGKHGQSDGYLVYVRLNGKVGIGGGPMNETGNEGMSKMEMNFTFQIKIDEKNIRFIENGVTVIEQEYDGDYKFLTPNVGGCSSTIQVKALSE